MLKVITGKNRGAHIIFPPSITQTRPTSSMVKHALFNIIQSDICGSRFLDLFAGSGQIGIEALSRGVKYVSFVDDNSVCCEYILKNIRNMNMQSSCSVNKSDVTNYMSRCSEIFDIIFMDPPYNMDFIKKSLPYVVKKVSNNGIIICETEKSEYLPETQDNFRKIKEYVYGIKKLTVYREMEDAL